MGKSGSGKSTLLNVMSTVDRPTEGRIFYYENMISSISEKMAASVRLNEFGFVYQKFHLIPTLNVYDNVCMPVSFSKKKPDYDYIDNILEELGIAEYKKKLPSQLSGGEQQRVAIARAMAHKPCIIFADEPTGNLDSENGNNVIRLLIENAKKYGQTLIYVTHDETLAGLAQRTIYLEDGKLKDKENV